MCGAVFSRHPQAQAIERRGMNELALFAGIGGGILGTSIIGHKCVCAVENEPHAQGVLLARQNDKTLEPFPIWDDVTTFDGTKWRGIVDCVSGGFPCQDISIAGKGKGLGGERSGLWRHMARIIGEVKPTVVFIENSPQLSKLGLDKVLFDLAEMGFNAEWGIFGADSVGANHLRQRMWIIGINSDKIDAIRENESCGRGAYKNFTEWSPAKVKQEWFGREFELDAVPLVDGGYAYSEAVRILDGIPDRMDRTARLGNAQVPSVAALAYLTLWNRLISK